MYREFVGIAWPESLVYVLDIQLLASFFPLWLATLGVV